jgi:hypothetical protein
MVRFTRSAAAALLGLTFGASCRSKPPNVLLVSIDALRADHLGAYGGDEGVSPFLDELAASGAVFENAFVPLPATDPSHASLLTSLHPLQHGVLANAMTLPEELETLAEVLRAHGYYTMGAVSVAHLGRAYGFGQGMDDFSDSWDGNAPSNDAHQRAGGDTNRSVFELVDSYLARESKQPYFLFVHYFDVHSPYVSHVPATGDSMAARYRSEVRFVDEKIGELVAFLRKKGLGENLVVAVTSDHGEQLGEHGYEGGHADIYRETIRVPLILNGTGIRGGRRDEIVTSMDIAPTVLDLAGLAFSRPVEGVSLLRARGPERDLLVLGYPSYTRSLGLLSNGRYFLRNLDPPYMHMVFEEVGVHGETGGMLPAEDLGEGRYWLRLVSKVARMEPVQVAVEVWLEDETCSAQLSVRAEPRLDYFAEPLSFRGAVRVHVPAITLRDAVTVTVQPADCVRSVRYLPSAQVDIDTFRAGLTGNFDTKATQIWTHLLTERKRRPGDELYRISSDPGMTTNVMDADARVERQRIVERWRELAPEPTTFPAGSYTEEERRLLRSLGYLP